MGQKIEIKNLSVNYNDKNTTFEALKDVSFDIWDGEFVSILGPSGCGKSTLLSVLAGLKAPGSGFVEIDGEQVTGPGTDRSVVFQNYTLFPWMTVRKNVAYGIAQAFPGFSRKERYERADEYLSKVGLSEHLNKFPVQLSGGQQQRVAIARSLAMDTDILLMDEPFGALDPKIRGDLQALLLKLWNQSSEKNSGKRKTVVFVTHDIDEAIYLSDRIVMMGANPGSVKDIVYVPFARPRDRQEIIRSETYEALRNRLINLYYGDDEERIFDHEKKRSKDIGSHLTEEKVRGHVAV